MQPLSARSVALDINQLHVERSNRIEAAALAADAASKLQHFVNLNSRIHQDVMSQQGAALLPLIIGPHGKIMAVFASASVCECEGCLSQEIHPTWSSAFEPYPPLVPGFPVPAAEIAAQAFAQAFMEELTWNQPDDDTFSWNTTTVEGIQVWIPKSSNTHELSYSQDSHAVQLHVDLEKLLESVSNVSLCSQTPHPYRSPPFFRNCLESSKHCNFVLPLTGWRLPHSSSNKRIACDPVVLDVRTVLILQDKRVQDYLHSATASILSSHAFTKSSVSSMTLIAAAACDGSNWSVCGSGCDQLVSQRTACASHLTPMFKLYVGCLASAESFDVIAHHGIKAIVNCCWKNQPLNHHTTRGIRYCVVGSDNSVKETYEVAEQRDICMRDWPAVLELALECRSAGVAMLIYSCQGKSRSGSLAALCLSYLNFPGCSSILASHLIVAKARACIQACNPAYLRWAQGLLKEQQHTDGCGDFPEVLQQTHERASLSWLLIDGKFGVPKNFKRAFEIALAGDQLSCMHCKGALARCYFAGHGVAKDTTLGMHLARESAAAGSCYGHFVLGVAHLKGENQQDRVQAVSHWRLAASQGLASAQHNLGTMYTNGQGIPQDHAAALKLYQLAASQDYSPAHYSLGHVYENGLGVPHNLPRAAQCYQSASLQSDGEFYCDAVEALERLSHVHAL